MLRLFLLFFILLPCFLYAQKPPDCNVPGRIQKEDMGKGWEYANSSMTQLRLNDGSRSETFFSTQQSYTYRMCLNNVAIVSYYSPERLMGILVMEFDKSKVVRQWEIIPTKQLNRTKGHFTDAGSGEREVQSYLDNLFKGDIKAAMYSVLEEFEMQDLLTGTPIVTNKMELEMLLNRTLSNYGQRNLEVVERVAMTNILVKLFHRDSGDEIVIYEVFPRGIRRMWVIK